MGNICDIFSFNKECVGTNMEIKKKIIIQLMFRF